MRALFTAIVAGIEAAAVGLLGLLVAVVPAILLWMATFDLAAEPLSVVGGAVAVWLLAHLVPLSFDLTSQTVASLGLPQQAIAFDITLAPLGLTLITAVIAVRSGWRFGARGGAGAAAVPGGMLGIGALTALAAPLAGPFMLWPLWAVIALPALIYGVCVAGGFLTRAVVDGHDWWRDTLRTMQRGIERSGLPGVAELPSRAGTAISLAVACVAAVTGVAAVAVSISMVAGYVQVAAVSQAMQLDGLGAVLLFLLQLALLPAAAWLSGVGFEVGAGSSVTPFETLTGPLPSLPLFGAIPNAWGALGALAPALIVLCGLMIGVLFTRKSPLRDAGWSVLLSLPVIAAAVSGLVFVGLGALAHGSIGPDRLADAGVSAWVFGGVAAAELGAGLLLGAACGRLDAGRLRQLAHPEKLRKATSPERLREAVASWGKGHRDPESVDKGSSLYAEDPDAQPTVQIDFDRSAETPGVVLADPEPNGASATGAAPGEHGDGATDASHEPETEPGAEAEVAEEVTAEVEVGVEAAETAEVVDDLVQAFSWDQLDAEVSEPEPEPGRKKPRGWRLPRRDS